MKSINSILISKTLVAKRLILFILPVLFLVSCLYERPDLGEYYKVTKVVDGDTFYVDDSTKKGKKIRLIGVDCPETKHPRKPVQYFGKEATEYMVKILAESEVKLVYDVELKDRYGRTLAYVYLKDGTFVNAKLVEEGYAQVATYPPNVKHTDLFLQLQRHARANNKGLWAIESE